ncbi:MAG: hypothetical protein WKH64_01760 [Chloroflexia bacterium]
MRTRTRRAAQGEAARQTQRAAPASAQEQAQGDADRIYRQAAPAVKPRQVVRREVVDKKQVQRGDYLRNIARKYYGDERLWPLIWEYNKARSKQSGQKLTDPDVIHPGWVFVMPKVDKSKPAK